jgi:chromosome segregation protein
LYLKRLEIKGFKSFADMTEINLKPGINIVVGPNGCGKSNIVDAIRWVLGETNVRHIRGQKNEDIIFNGTDKKKSQGMAYAEIIVDNFDHVLPVEFNEVTVERKSFRSGESEFYLNKTRVRMKDIVELFTGTGLGKKGYSIINQGELEQVLNGQPLERRLILEEASGIIRHRQKRDEVKKRLTETSNDILRLGDLLGELEARKEEVREKAEKAAVYIDAASEHDELERHVLTHEWLKINEDIKTRKTDLTSHQVQLEETKAKITMLENELQLNDVDIKDNQSLLARLKEERYAYESALSSIESETRLSQEKIKNARERMATADQDSGKYLSMLNSLSLDIEETLVAFGQDQEQFAKRQQEYLQMEKEVLMLAEKIKLLKIQFEEKKTAVFSAVRQETELGNHIVKNEEELKRAGERAERINIHVEDITNKITASKDTAADLHEQITLCEKQHNDNLKSLERFKREKEILQKSGQELLQQYDELKNQIQAITNKLSVHQEMQKNLAGYSQGVKAIVRRFTAGRDKISGYIGIIGELIDVKPGLETAVEIALNRGMENIVVESIDDARRAINILKDNNMGRVTFLPLDALKIQPITKSVLDNVKKTEGVLGLGSELVDYDKHLKKAIEYLLGRVLVVKDADIAIKIYKNMNFPGRIVTLEGELINTSGAITGGSRAPLHMGVIQRKGEEKKLAQLLQQLKDKAALLWTKLEQHRQQIKDIEQSISQDNNRVIEQSFKLQMLIKQKEQTHEEGKSLTQQYDSYLQELQQINKDSARLTDINSRLLKEKDALLQRNSTLSDELEMIKQSIEIDTRDFEVSRERLNSNQEQLEMKTREMENNRKNIAQFEQVKESYQESLKTANELKERMQNTIIKENDSMEQKRQMIVEHQEKLQEVEENIAIAGERSKDFQNAAYQLNQQLIPLRQKAAENESSNRNLELTIARLETEQDNLIKKWQEKYNENLLGMEFEASFSNADIRRFIRQIAELKTQIDDLWPVDLQSVNEYEEISARYIFQKQQYEDLAEARDSLHRLLEETEKIMIKDFSHFLLLANESFKKTFREVFGGGEALLRLTPAHNAMLDAGVEIEVKMPGKRMQSLDLLSGGERALTCIAFIFALLGLRPAPFCLLDEIDASLDETNLIRFANFLKKMSDNMQFIIITHRQTTIAAGENIYGVTMPEKGVSSVLTLNIQDAENLAG